MDELERERTLAAERAVDFVAGWSGSRDGLLLFACAIIAEVARRTESPNAVKWRAISLVKEVEA